MPGAMGFIRTSETHIQVVYGPKVEAIAANVRECLRSGKVIPAAAKVKHQLLAPVSGGVVPMKEAPDETFSSCMMGDGVVIHPTDNVIKAPCSGTVGVYTEENRHAIGLQTEDGLELLIHIGVDTVNLKGEGFEGLVSAGDRIKAGDALIRFDREDLEKKGYCTDVMLIVMDNDGQFDVKYTTGMTAEAGKTVVAEY